MTNAPALSSIFSAHPQCPFCNSSARKEIDLLIHARHFSPDGEQANLVIDENGLAVAGEPVEHNDNYEQTLQEIQELLSKLPSHNTKEFNLTDLIIHALDHNIVTDIRNARVKAEGGLLFAGDMVYQVPDLKDFLQLVIAETARQILSGQIKMTAKIGIEAATVLWRMSGNAGNDDLIQGMIEKVTKGEIAFDSPLGKAYAERQAALTGQVAPEPSETTQEAEPETTVTDA